MVCLIFRSPSTILQNIALWARALNLPFAHVPICMHGRLGIQGRTGPIVSMFVNTYNGSLKFGYMPYYMAFGVPWVYMSQYWHFGHVSNFSCAPRFEVLKIVFWCFGPELMVIRGL